jgi:hypothetical protein
MSTIQQNMFKEAVEQLNWIDLDLDGDFLNWATEYIISNYIFQTGFPITGSNSVVIVLCICMKVPKG